MLNVIERTNQLIETGVISLPDNVLRLYNILQERIPDQQYTMESLRPLIRNLLVISPPINFIMGAQYIEQERGNTETQYVSHLLDNEVIDPQQKKETIMYYQVEAHSGLERARHQKIISVLDKVIKNYNLRTHPLWKEMVDTENKPITKKVLKDGKEMPIIANGSPLTRPKTEIEKGCLRIDYMTRILIDSIKNDTNRMFYTFKQHFKIILDIPEENIHQYLDKSLNELSRNTKKTLMGYGKVDYFLFKKHPYFTSFFKALRAIDPKSFNLDFDLEAIGELDGRQQGNYVHKSVTDFINMNGKKGMNKLFDDEMSKLNLFPDVKN